ncbi:hypothetical protein [Flavobacterium sp. LM4]|uniref:hypothetical protein n=1 Tax=Flavobacterium sp. LM4 TaxID=1938609 RepID=UPI0009947BAC|nr:hypothetical protein [Flavobacterium sp. LM4]OOV20477.1 hypothetical protein BXU10_13055 [Flavobacterium sp. LM4]
MKIKITLIVTLFIFIGCKDKEPDIDYALSEVTAKFPQILKGGINQYKFEKSVKNGKYNFEIQLYSQTDTVRDPQKIMVFINSKKECYAIPFLSNTHRDYWEFRNEKSLPGIIKKVNTTFTRQYIEALNALHINTSEICNTLTNEILMSLLNCGRVSQDDSQYLKSLVFYNGNGLVELNESDKELKEKLLKNYEEIIRTPNTDINSHKSIALGYLDYKNYRFYQVVFKYDHINHPTIKGKEIITKTTLQIKSYRHDRVVNMMSSSF